MKIFLSHASEDKNVAERIYLALINAGHQVFFDRTGVQGGDDFNAHIQKNIKKCELLIFLISPDSVAKSSYALTELKFARDKWPHPHSHILPVVVRQTSYEAIPEYLKAVTILEPEGNTAAEVRERLTGWRKRHRHSTMRRLVIVSLVLLVNSIIAILIWKNWKDPETPVVYNPGPSTIVPANNVNTSVPIKTSSSPSNNIEDQAHIPNQATPNEKSNQVVTAEPTPIVFPLSSRVLDGEQPIKGAKISIVGSPEQGVVQSDKYGIFTLKIVNKQLNDTVTIQVEYNGFETWRDAITLGEAPPMIYLKRKK